jgi:hypothetical protein
MICRSGDAIGFVRSFFSTIYFSSNVLSSAKKMSKGFKDSVVLTQDSAGVSLSNALFAHFADFKLSVALLDLGAFDLHAAPYQSILP